MITPTAVPDPPSPLRAVAVFLAAGLLVLTAVGVVLAKVQHDLAEKEAVRDARVLTETSARLLAPYLQGPALVPGQPEHVRLDTTVRERVIGEQVVQVKIWRPDGTIVYSNDASLIGKRFELSQDELDVFRPGSKPVAEISDLEEDENEAQREFDRLMQVYVGVGTDGDRLLFEAYHSYDTIAAASRQRTLSFLPVLVGGLALLWLAQAPLAWRMASRLRAVHDEREQLLVAALAASDRERSRIAADLHDGVVQRLSGASYTLTAEAARVSSAGHRDTGDVLHGLAVDLRRTVRELRSLIVTITPPGLRRQPLLASLKDLVAPLEDRGIDVRVAASEAEVEQEVVDLVLRTAQEAVRNILRHAGARTATIELRADEERVVLAVVDDGAGFRPGPDAGRRDSMGLDLLNGLAQQLGGHLEVRSAPGAGTQLELVVPVRASEPVPA